MNHVHFEPPFLPQRKMPECYICTEPVLGGERDEREPVKCTTCGIAVHAECLAKMGAAMYSRDDGRLDVSLQCGHCRAKIYPCVKTTHAAGKSDFMSDSDVVMYLFHHHLSTYNYYMYLLSTMRETMFKTKTLLRPGVASYARRVALVELQEIDCDIIAHRLGLENEDEFEDLAGNMM